MQYEAFDNLLIKFHMFLSHLYVYSYVFETEKFQQKTLLFASWCGIQ